MACWLALDHLPPDTGTMRFLEGSHKSDLFGRIPASEDPHIMAADNLYTGASCVYTDGLDLPIEQPIRHPKFPQIWPAGH
jgi:ectoine hydroxylase-related dioxygenase (phytanoyl-CoA dioxygenase family)